MPFGDLTVSEGTLVRWPKAAGDAVTAGEVVAEIETDKAVVEIEAPVAGRLGPIEKDTGAVVPMGGRIGSVKAEWKQMKILCTNWEAADDGDLERAHFPMPNSSSAARRPIRPGFLTPRSPPASMLS